MNQILQCSHWQLLPIRWVSVPHGLPVTLQRSGHGLLGPTITCFWLIMPCDP